MSHVASVGPAQLLATSLQETESALDVAALLRRLVDAAAVGFSVAAYACVTLPGRGGPSTVVFSNDLPFKMDSWPYESGQGPSQDELLEPHQVSDDLTGETRWPSFSPDALSPRIGSVVSFGLGAHGRWFGVLSGREAFASSGSEAYETGSALAAVASLGLLADRETADLPVPLASRDVIGPAKGILMERCRNLFHEAFRMLVRWSQNGNVKLRAVAAQLVWSGELPWAAARHEDRPKALLV